jgi:hypothetical protein
MGIDVRHDTVSERLVVEMQRTRTFLNRYKGVVVTNPELFDERFEFAAKELINDINRLLMHAKRR